MVAYIFLSELCNYVLSFVVGIIVPFKYIDNKTSMICTRYRTPIFFLFCFLSHTSNTYVSLTFPVVILKLIRNPFNWYKSISFYHWNLNGLLVHNHEKFHLVEALIVLILTSSLYQKRILVHLLIIFTID